MSISQSRKTIIDALHVRFGETLAVDERLSGLDELARLGRKPLQPFFEGLDVIVTEWDDLRIAERAAVRVPSPQRRVSACRLQVGPERRASQPFSGRKN